MSNPRTAALSSAGVSIWLDDLSRTRIESGNLAELVDSINVVGVTTNPTIFANAIGSGEGYGERIAAAAAAGLSAEQTVFSLMCSDVADACDILKPVAVASSGQDGRVSIEVSPTLSRDTAGTIAQARELWAQVNRENAMIKIPATVEGLEAISEVIGSGISVNVTLIFSLERYRQVINAYLVGIEKARAAGHDISKIHSVASFFVSRVDTLIDGKLDAIVAADPTQVETVAGLRSKAGLANARLAYEVFEQGFSTERAQMLIDLGANLQRPLWASTGVKDPQLPDTLYVSGLVAEQTVNTMPEATLNAYADHGELEAVALHTSYRESDAVLNDLDGLGIDYAEVTEFLEVDGLKKFEASWAELLQTVETALLENK